MAQVNRAITMSRSDVFCIGFSLEKISSDL